MRKQRGAKPVEVFAGTRPCQERVNRAEAGLASFGYTSPSTPRLHPAWSQNSENPGEKGRRKV